MYRDIDMRNGEPLVWMTPYFYCKKFSSDIVQPYITVEQVLLFPRVLC